MIQDQKEGLDALIAVATTRAIAVERELAENLRDACADKPALAEALVKVFERYREGALAALLHHLGSLHNEELQLRTKAASLAVERYVPLRRLARHGR